MNLRQIECFWTVGTQCSFSKASEILFISQSSVSKYVASLEKELQVKLIIRDGRTVSLSSDGRKLLPHCGEILKAFSQFKDEANLARTGTARERVTLYGIPPMVEYGMIELISTFKSQSSLYDVFVVEKDETDLLVEMQLDICDIVFCSDLHVDKEQYYFHPIQQESLVALLPPHHRLAQHSEISFRDLVSCEFIFPSTGSMLDKLCYEICESCGIQPKVIAQSASPTSSNIMLGKNSNCCWINIATLASKHPHQWHVAKLLDAPVYHVGFCWKKQSSNNSTLREFIKFMTNLYPL